jgi:hypothetical protein
MMNSFRSTRRALFVAATVLGFGVAGCSTPSGPGAQSSAPESFPSAAETSGTPSTEPSGPEAPRPSGNGEVAIVIAQLPVGGGSNPDGDGKQCATASWNQPDLLPDSGVTVTRIDFTPPKGFQAIGGCGDSSACAGFTFRPGGDRSCSVLVRELGRSGGKLTLRGTFACPPGQGSSCRQLPGRVQGGEVSLDPPEGETTSESPATESSPDSVESSPSPSP